MKSANTITIMTMTLYAENKLQGEHHDTIDLAVAYAKEESRWEKTVFSLVLVDGLEHTKFTNDN